MTCNVLNEIQDHREERTQEHPVDEIIFSALVSLWDGANSWDEIIMFSSTKLDYLREFLPFKNGIPSQDTYNRLFSLLDDAGLEKAFVSLSQWLISKNFTDLQSNADGTAMADVLPASDDMIHMLSACGDEFAISLRQLNVAAKSNEITAIPLLLQKLNITKAEVSSNALDAQTELAQLIQDKKGYYLLAVNDNQPSLFNEVQELCGNYQPQDSATEVDEQSDLSGECKCEVFKVNKKVIKTAESWAGLKQIIKMNEMKGDIRYYIVNSKYDASHYLDIIKSHCSIDDTCPWQLDVTFNEDEERKAKNADKNFARLRRFALNYVRSFDFGEQLNKSSVRCRCFALSNSKELLIKLLFHVAQQK